MTQRRGALARSVAAIAVASLSLVGIGTAFGARAAAPSHTGAKSAGDHRWIMGYYPIYQRALMPVNEIDWSAMTHLVVGAVLPRANGSLDTTFYDDATHGPRIARKLVTAAKSHGVVPILMVGGAGAHNGFAAAASHHRATLVHNLLSMMRSYHFAGLDLDWEPVATSEQPTINALVTALRQQAPHAILTMPVAWVTTTFPKVSAFYGTLANKLDRINIMTYGMAGAYDGWKTWHSSALSGARSSTPSDIAVNVHSYEAAGVPADKLGIGIGFYGMCWAGGASAPRQRVGSSYVAADDNVMTYTRIMSTYYSASAYHYDGKAQAPYLGFSAPTGPKRCTFISYENARSIAAKGAYAEQQGLGSEIVWTINQAHAKGSPRSTADPLLRAVHDSFH